jgi:hypothetical protein
MSWLWHRPATGSPCIRRCAVGERHGVVKISQAPRRLVGGLHGPACLEANKVQ